jgi:hypothetical protein
MHTLSNTPTVVGKLQARALDAVLPSSPEMLLEEAEELARESGTLYEQRDTVKKITSTLQTVVLSSPVAVWPESCRRLMRQNWCWFKESWSATIRDSPTHPSAANRSAVMRAVLSLAKWLLHSNSNPFVLIDISTGRAGSESHDTNDGTALTMLAECLGAQIPHQAYVAHPLVPIQTAILDIIALAIERASTNNEAEVLDRFAECGVGNCIAAALAGSTELLRKCNEVK